MAFPYFYYQFNKLRNPEMNTPETWWPVMGDWWRWIQWMSLRLSH